MYTIIHVIHYTQFLILVFHKIHVISSNVLIYTLAHFATEIPCYLTKNNKNYSIKCKNFPFGNQFSLSALSKIFERCQFGVIETCQIRLQVEKYIHGTAGARDRLLWSSPEASSCKSVGR